MKNYSIALYCIFHLFFRNIYNSHLIKKFTWITWKTAEWAKNAQLKNASAAKKHRIVQKFFMKKINVYLWVLPYSEKIFIFQCKISPIFGVLVTPNSLLNFMLTHNEKLQIFHKIARTKRFFDELKVFTKIFEFIG